MIDMVMKNQNSIIPIIVNNIRMIFLLITFLKCFLEKTILFFNLNNKKEYLDKAQEALKFSIQALEVVECKEARKTYLICFQGNFKGKE